MYELIHTSTSDINDNDFAVKVEHNGRTIIEPIDDESEAESTAAAIIDAIS